MEDCSLYTVDQTKDMIQLVTSTRIPTDFWKRRDVYLNKKGLTAYVARSGDILNLGENDFRQHHAWSGEFLEHLQYLPSKRCHSLLLGPLHDTNGELIGVLKLENRLGTQAENCFSEFEAQLFRTFAYSISMAIEVTKSFERRLEEETRQQVYERLSRELHDVNNTVHGAIVIGSNNARDWLAVGNYSQVGKELERISKGGQHVEDELEYLRMDLNDDKLSLHGLISSIKIYSSEILHLNGSLQAKEKIIIPNEIQAELYKIARTALNNVSKHSQTTDFTLEIMEEDGILELRIKDMGVGFDANTVMNLPTSFGLQNMKWRAQKIGGKFEIDSSPNQGTQICVTITI